MIDDREVAELVKFAELLTLNTQTAVEITSAAIRDVARVRPRPLPPALRALLFRSVAHSALRLRDDQQPH